MSTLCFGLAGFSGETLLWNHLSLSLPLPPLSGVGIRVMLPHETGWDTSLLCFVEQSTTDCCSFLNIRKHCRGVIRSSSCPCDTLGCRGELTKSLSEGSQRPGGAQLTETPFTSPPAPRQTRSLGAGAPECPTDSSAGPLCTRGPGLLLRTRAPGHPPEDPSGEPTSTARRGRPGS